MAVVSKGNETVELSSGRLQQPKPSSCHKVGSNRRSWSHRRRGARYGKGWFQVAGSRGVRCACSRGSWNMQHSAEEHEAASFAALRTRGNRYIEERLSHRCRCMHGDGSSVLIAFRQKWQRGRGHGLAACRYRYGHVDREQERGHGAPRALCCGESSPVEARAAAE